MPDAELKLFGDAVKQSCLDEGEADYWVKKINSSNEEPLIALLMTLLPNLTFIRSEADLAQGAGEMIYAMLITNILDKNSAKALERLRTVEFYGSDEAEKEDLVELDVDRSHSGGSRVGTIFGRFIAANKDNTIFINHSDSSSKLTRLVLTKCAVNVRELAEFFCAIEGLQNFYLLAG